MDLDLDFRNPKKKLKMKRITHGKDLKEFKEDDGGPFRPTIFLLPNLGPFFRIS